MTRDRFHAEVDALEDQVADMAALAKSMLSDGVACLDALDRDRAVEIVARAEELADRDEAIEHRILQLLSLQSPVAKDLRRMGAALKLITYINRVGRYGYDIARVAQNWPEGREHVARMVNLRDMAQKVEAMLELVLEAFRESKAPDRDALMALEEDVDALRLSVWRETLTYMAQDSKNIEPCAHYMMVARYLERCGDNVCKMAEKLHYAATGQRILLN